MQITYLYPSHLQRKINRIKKLINHSPTPQQEVSQERLRVIEFFDKYGQEATREAFRVARSTIYLWKKRLRESQGDPHSLIPLSRAPRKRRKRETSPVLIRFIREYRKNHPRVGKESIKLELDEFCIKEGIKTISTSTIGRILKELKSKGFLKDNPQSLSYNARSDRFTVREKKKEKKLRRKGYLPQNPGDLVQIDTITIFLNGVKRYLLSGIDLKTRFAFSWSYASLTSLNSRDFMERFLKVAPFTIKRLQTDNGSEFEGHFKDHLKRKSITHFHIYPRHPQSNAHIERFQRTLQEQHVDWNLSELYDTEEFNRSLMEYLIWYNTKKSHKSLAGSPPLRYYIDTFIQDTKKSNMLWTLTGY